MWSSSSAKAKVARGGAAVLAAAWIIGRLHLPRIVLWLILLTFLVLMDAGLVGL